MCEIIVIKGAISCNHFDKDIIGEVLLHHHDEIFKDIVFDIDSKTGVIDFDEELITLTLNYKGRIVISTQEFCFKKHKNFALLSINIPEIQFVIAFPFEYFYLPTRNKYNNHYMLEIGLLSNLTDGIF